MDEARQKEGKRRVDEELQLGSARLFRVVEQKKVKEEVARTKELLYAHFKEQGPKKELELILALHRLLMSFSKLASYYGVLKGYRLASRERDLHEDQARIHLLLYLQAHPKAGNKDLVAYLDRKNSRLEALRTRSDSEHWAPLPAVLQRKFGRQGMKEHEGFLWEAALREFPKETREFLSRTKRMARETSVKNALIAWPRIIREHRRERSRT